VRAPKTAREQSKRGEAGKTAGPAVTAADAPPQRLAQDGVLCQPLALADAVALAFRLRPRLRASLEGIAQARGREDVAIAAFLPSLTSVYSVGGAGIPLSN
jgi:outer membrane protein TolC